MTLRVFTAHLVVLGRLSHRTNSARLAGSWDFPASTSPVLELKACVAEPGFSVLLLWLHLRPSMLVRRALYPLTHLPALRSF
jgi:hypothetical protein